MGEGESVAYHGIIFHHYAPLTPPSYPGFTMSDYEVIHEGVRVSIITGDQKDNKNVIGHKMGIIDKN